MNKIISLCCIASVALMMNSCKPKGGSSSDSAAFEKDIQEKLINAKEGEVIELPEGTFDLSRPLVLDGIKNITIKGKGMDKTILNFKGQKDGAEGLRVTANGVVLEDFTILDAKGDCIKIQDGTNVTMRRLKSGWTTLHSTANGSYGLYPVSCTNVLIEECEVMGSSDAGIYVGQSKNVVVRKNKVHDNVAGIEIENCTDADVYENTSTNNTGGVLVFDLPDLPVKNGARCKVHNNQIIDNNVKNFGPKGTAVSEIPAGTGVIIMATNQCEVFGNEIRGNNSVSVAVISYLALQRPYKDTIYDPYCGGISIHDNKIMKGAGSLDNSTAFGQLFGAVFGDKVPELVFDGAINPSYKNTDGTIKEEQKICFKNNGDAKFTDLDLAHKSQNRSDNISKFDCSLPAFNEVKLNQ